MYTYPFVYLYIDYTYTYVYVYVYIDFICGTKFYNKFSGYNYS